MLSTPQPSPAPGRRTPVDFSGRPALPRRLRAARGWAALALGVALGACTGAQGPARDGGSSYTVSVTVSSAVGPAESFRFGLAGTTQIVTVTQSGVPAPFPAALASGSSYAVNQLDGPRTCTLSTDRQGTLAADVGVTADCGAPPGGAGLAGTLRGPVGAQAVLQNNGSDDLPVTVVRSVISTDDYDVTPFAFATQLPDGAAYQVSVKTPPAGQSCAVYAGATGTMPVGADAVRVGCEHIYDLVSRSFDDADLGTFFESGAPSIGGSDVAVGATVDGYGEGRFVAFVSSAAGLGGATGARRQVFWRDRMSRQTLLLSASAAGVEGNDDSFAPAIAADGLTVAFESYASNLVAGDTNAVRDVFVWSALTPNAGVRRASVGPGGVEANAESFEPTVSGDGRLVAFSTGASNLTPGVSGINTINVVLRDLAAGTNALVSATAGGVGVGGSKPALAEDGSRLAFHSISSQLVAGDTNGLWDVFVYDVLSTGLQRVSLTSGGGERNQGSESASRVVAPAISGDGRYVAFATTATNMTSGDTNGAQDVFVVDTQTGSVVRASVDDAGAPGNGDSPVGQGARVSLSSDGRWVAFSTNASNLGAPAGNVLMRDWVYGETRVVSSMSGGSVGEPSMSRTGAYVVFGAGQALDPRFASTGLFARFTGVARAWWWID
jgi:Tol biopolymer transport system component